MAIGLTEPEKLIPVSGIRLASAAAQIRYPNRNDVVLIELSLSSSCAAVFTQNAFCAAPVIVARQHLTAERPRFLLINSGNANAGTGERGLLDAQQSCTDVAEMTKCLKQQVLPFSTGVIGEHLPVKKIQAVVPELISKLSDDNWNTAMRAIMTTDTVPKGISRTVDIEGKHVTITGISKGSGMIRPDMATMLAYIATDASIENKCLQKMLELAVENSFNRITVDGDTSTNDACVLIATGKANNKTIIDVHAASAEKFQSVLNEVCQFLAQAIIRDGEGVSKFVSVIVNQAETIEEAKQVAYTVAQSPLVKTALFAGDANWGRILAAVGRAGLKDLDINGIQIFLGDICIVHQGGRHEDYTDDQGQAVMSNDEIEITINLSRGNINTTVWTTDLSYEYIKINAEYRT